MKPSLLSLTRLLAMTCLIFVGIQTAMAQANRGSITGTVTDSTGAVVAGVEVTATNTGTNVPTKSRLQWRRHLRHPQPLSGQYSVEFKRDGFETLLRPAVTLESTQGGPHRCPATSGLG